jgi:pimeloyl-ACP methyl ester carboxylesterase
MTVLDGATTAADSVTTAAGQLGLECRSAGDGPPLLFLHGEPGLLFCEPALARLSEHFSVVAPSHPGWGASPRRPSDRSIDDLAYRYLDLVEAFDDPPLLVGCSFGAWLAMEIATKDESHIAGLVLVAPVGIRTGEPTRRYYVDRYAASPEALTIALYGGADGAPDLAERSDPDLLLLARAQEATAFYTWQPYLHNPSLLDRLHRVRSRTLVVSGGHDGFVLAQEHVQTLCGALGGEAQTVVFDDTGHQVEEQRPDELADCITAFARHAALAGK